MSVRDEEHRILYLRLLDETRLLFLIYHRNKNQHKRSHWWKGLNSLKRNSDQVVKLLSRKRIEKKPELACLFHLLDGFMKRQLKKTYLDFNGVVALGQFITMGVVLIGILSRVYSIYGKLFEYYEPLFKEAGFMRMPKEKLLETNKVMESLVEQELEESLPSKAVKEPSREAPVVSSRPKKKASKKKKKKSAIDSIFG